MNVVVLTELVSLAAAAAALAWSFRGRLEIPDRRFYRYERPPGEVRGRLTPTAR